MLVSWLFAFSAVAETKQTPINVLFLSSYHIEGKGTANFVKGLHSAFSEDTSVSINHFTEYMDMMRFKGEEHKKQLFELYLSKYGNIKIDFVISHASPALDFLLEYRDVLFPGVPVVFSLVPKSIIGKRTIPSDYTGITSGPDFYSTLDVALKLLPATENVLIVGGTSPVDKQYFVIAKNQLKPFENKINIIYLNQIGMDDMLKQVANQPKRTIIIYALIQQDGTGKCFLPRNAATRIAKVANVPMFAVSQTQMDTGVVGGLLMSMEMIGKKSAKTALEIINGTKQTVVTTYSDGTHVFMFDWHQLKRWGIDETNLAPESVILHRKVSFWERHYHLIIGTATLILLETLLIALLLINRSKRTRIEQFLRESEERLKETAMIAKVGGWEIDLLSNKLSWTEETFRIHELEDDRSPDVATAIQYYHPEDQKIVTDAVQHAIKKGESFDFETRLITEKNNLKWVRAIGNIVLHQGSRVGVRGMIQDITEHKQAEEQIKASLREKETLLQELYHRTKNNMQVIHSLLFQNAKKCFSSGVQELVKNMEHKIQTMSLVHQMLYQSKDLSYIDAGEYVKRLTSLILQSYDLSPQKVRFVLDIEKVSLLIDTAIPLGLVLNELISNSLENAFPGERKGVIKICISRNESGKISLTVSDNGIGVPEEFDFRNQEMLGLKMITGIVEKQMDGSIKFKITEGLTCKIEFSDTLYKKRV